MENFFQKAMSLSPENGIETEADTFLALAIAHNVFKVKILKKPERQDDKSLAKMINDFHENGFEGDQGKTNLENILGNIASKNGLEPPKFEIEQDSILSSRVAGANPNNTIKFSHKRIVGQHKFCGQTFGQCVKSVGHESQHLKQFFFIKEFLTGNNDVDIKYKIMAFQEIFEFCGIKTSKLDFLANEKYWYNAMEIDARKTGAELVFNLIKNKDLNRDARQSLVYFAQSQLEESATMYESGKKLLKQLSFQIKKFEKEFADCPLADCISKEFHGLETEMMMYAKSLDCYGYELPVKIMQLREDEKVLKRKTKEESFEQK